MSHTYEKLDGYKFLCKIFALISRNTNMREIFQENVDDISNTANDEIVMTYLAENWDRFCSMVLDSNPEIKDCILEHFNQFHPGKTKGTTLEKFQELWKTQTVKALVKERRETRDPQVAFGIAETLAVGLDQSNKDFYIGLDEAKKILFLCLKYFGYEDVEFIPEECFEEETEKENFRKLFFSALYSTLLYLYPANNGNARKKNFESGTVTILEVIQSDAVSKLFTAFQNVAEAKMIAEQLWGNWKIDGQCLSVSGAEKLPMSEFYIIPDIVSDRRMGILTCESGQAVRSLVEGRSGCGKSTLAKMIALICQNDGNDVLETGKYRELASKLDLRRRMWPIILDCKELKSEEIEDGLICAGLRQMVSRANQDGAEINYRHYQECEPYLLAFCNHKIMQAELLVIVDDYSKIPENCITEFNRLLRELCKRLTLHVVVITDTLKPSEKFRLNEAFYGSHNEFAWREIYPDLTYVSSVVNTWGECDASAIKLDPFVQLYVNTPRRLFRYAQALLNDESIYSIVDSCLEEELDLRKKYIRYRDEYPEFFRSLTLRALRERKEKERKSSKLTISEKQARKVKNENESWNEIWSCIETESILLEQCDTVNSLEFSTPLYLYDVLMNYYLELLQDRISDRGSEPFLEEFSCLSCMEFAYVLGLLFNKLYEDEFEGISDLKVEYFVKAVVAKLFEVETMEDLEYCQWAVSFLMEENYKTAFIHSGNPARRERIWRVLQRAYISLEVCKDAFCNCGLLVP